MRLFFFYLNPRWLFIINECKASGATSLVKDLPLYMRTRKKDKYNLNKVVLRKRKARFVFA